MQWYRGFPEESSIPLPALLFGVQGNQRIIERKRRRAWDSTDQTANSLLHGETASVHCNTGIHPASGRYIPLLPFISHPFSCEYINTHADTPGYYHFYRGPDEARRPHVGEWWSFPIPGPIEGTSLR